MSQAVTDADGTTHNFPDDATPEMIAQALGVSFGGGVDYDPMKSLQNAPDSAYKYGSDLLTGLASMSPYGEQEDGGTGFRKPPVIDSLATLASGAAQHATGLADEAKAANVPTPSADVASAVSGHYGDRYGSWDNFKQTAMDDPVGVLADLSIPVTLGGTAAVKGAQVLGKTGKLTKTAAMAEKLAKGLQVTGQSLDPLGAVQQLSKPLYKLGAGHVVGKQIDDLGDVNRIVDKAYDANIPMNAKGLDKVDDLSKAGMMERGKILDSIDGDFAVKPAMTPNAGFVDDVLTPSSRTRGALTVDAAGKKVARVSGNEISDQLRAGQTQGAVGLNKIKERQWRAANDLGAFGPESKKTLDALTHRQMGSQLRQMLEDSAERVGFGQGKKLADLNADFGDYQALGRALAKTLGKQKPGFGIDYSVRSASGAAGLSPGGAVTAGAIAGNYGSAKATSIALALKNSTAKAAFKQGLIQEGRTEKEADKIIMEISNE